MSSQNRLRPGQKTRRSNPVARGLGSFPVSEILKIEQAAVAQYENRKTEFPSQFAKAPAKRGRAWPIQESRIQGAARWQSDRSKGQVNPKQHRYAPLSERQVARARNQGALNRAGGVRSSFFTRCHSRNRRRIHMSASYSRVPAAVHPRGSGGLSHPRRGNAGTPRPGISRLP